MRRAYSGKRIAVTTKGERKMTELELALYVYGSGLIGGLIQAWRHPKYDTPVVFAGLVLGPLTLLIVILDWKLEPWEKEDECR